jgi:hypothetical protein
MALYHTIRPFSVAPQSMGVSALPVVNQKQDEKKMEDLIRPIASRLDAIDRRYEDITSRTERILEHQMIGDIGNLHRRGREREEEVIRRVRYPKHPKEEESDEEEEVPSDEGKDEILTIDGPFSMDILMKMNLQKPKGRNANPDTLYLRKVAEHYGIQLPRGTDKVDAVQIIFPILLERGKIEPVAASASSSSSSSSSSSPVSESSPAPKQKKIKKPIRAPTDD